MDNNNDKAGNVFPSQPLPAVGNSFGEQRVRVYFNPDNSGLIHQLKSKTAEIINILQTIGGLDQRLAAIAMTEYEVACMVGVKLASTEYSGPSGLQAAPAVSNVTSNAPAVPSSEPKETENVA